MPDKVFVDTNILVYLVNEDSPFNKSVEKKFKELVEKYGHKIFISRQVLREYNIEKWSRIFKVLNETEETTKVLLRLIETYKFKGKRIHDANIIATMIVNSIKRLFTLNTNDFKNFKEVEVIGILMRNF